MHAYIIYKTKKGLLSYKVFILSTSLADDNQSVSVLFPATHCIKPKTQSQAPPPTHTHISTQPCSAPSSLQIIMSNRLNCYKKTLRGAALIVTGICNAGQYRNVTDNECYDCPIGQYQPDSLQMECLPCDRNLTTRQEGSNNVNQCVCECFTQLPMLIIARKHLYLAH